MTTKKFAWKEALDPAILEELHVLLMQNQSETEIAVWLHDQGQMMSLTTQTIAQELRRYKKALLKETHAPEAAEDGGFDPLDEMRKLAIQQRKRVQDALAKEQEIKLPMEATGKAMKDYQDTLRALQEMQAKAQPVGGGGRPKSVVERAAEAIAMAEQIMNGSLRDGT